MSTTLQVKISPEEMIQAGKKMKKKEREAFLEDLFAATSSDYLKSIRDARADYKAKRTKSHDEVFDG